MNKLNNLQLGFPLQLMMEAIRGSVARVHEEASTSTENLIKSQKAIAMKTSCKPFIF